MSQQTDKSTRKKQNNKTNKPNQNDRTRETAAWWLRGARCSSRHPFNSSQLSATLVLVNLAPSPGLLGYCMRMVHLHTHKQNTHKMHKNTKILNKTTAETEAAEAHIFSTWEAEAGTLEFEASLVYIGILGQAQVAETKRVCKGRKKKGAGESQ